MRKQNSKRKNTNQNNDKDTWLKNRDETLTAHLKKKKLDHPSLENEMFKNFRVDRLEFSFGIYTHRHGQIYY